jgi:3'-phosphoadenosine 5'-phosphosulfate (PAPS) 3'-phosphatase
MLTHHFVFVGLKTKGVEKYSDARGQCREMAKVIHGEGAVDEEGEIIRARRIDSQAKHGVLARAGAEFYVRLPRPGYVEWIWDIAAGNVVIEEAGGAMTDVEGNPIDFSLGAQLSAGVTGVLASNGGVFHSALLEAYRKQEESRLAGSFSNLNE